VTTVTYDEVQKRQQKAINFARNYLQDDDLADRLESESPEDYADRKRLKISNSERRITNMADGDTKSDLQDAIDAAVEALSSVYTPEASREDMAAGIADALDALDGGDDDDDDGDDGYDDSAA
jgi:hypothetical protein